MCLWIPLPFWGMPSLYIQMQILSLLKSCSQHGLWPFSQASGNAVHQQSKWKCREAADFWLAHCDLCLVRVTPKRVENTLATLLSTPTWAPTIVVQAWLHGCNANDSSNQRLVAYTDNTCSRSFSHPFPYCYSISIVHIDIYSHVYYKCNSHYHRYYTLDLLYTVLVIHRNSQSWWSSPLPWAEGGSSMLMGAEMEVATREVTLCKSMKRSSKEWKFLFLDGDWFIINSWIQSQIVVKVHQLRPQIWWIFNDLHPYFHVLTPKARNLHIQKPRNGTGCREWRQEGARHLRRQDQPWMKEWGTSSTGQIYIMDWNHGLKSWING